jgi:hypothetical protein
MQVAVPLLAGLGGVGEKEHCLQDAGVDGEPGSLAYPGKDLELSQAYGFFAMAIYCDLWEIFFLRCGGHFSVRSWELEARSSRSDAFPVESWWTMAEACRWKGAPELLALATGR